MQTKKMTSYCAKNKEGNLGLLTGVPCSFFGVKIQIYFLGTLIIFVFNYTSKDRETYEIVSLILGFPLQIESDVESIEFPFSPVKKHCVHFRVFNFVVHFPNK